MDRRTSSYLRERIVRLWEQGMSVSQILRKLHSEGRNTTRLTVRRWIFRWRTAQGLRDQHRSGVPSLVTSEIADFIVHHLESDDEISSAELHRHIFKKFNKDISTSTIRRYIRRNLKWAVVRTRIGPMISATNKTKRMDFAQMCIDAKDEFCDVIWTDESSVQLKRHCTTMRVKVGKEKVIKPAPKHPIKVHVWAGISMKGATHICIFDQIMDGPLYVKILDNFLLPFIQTFPDGNYRFMQDNDPKHTSRVAKEFYLEKGIKWWKTPASSADFNPIERVWRELKYFICRHVKPLTKKDLVDGIRVFWSTRMTPEKCEKYIRHTYSVLPKIVEKEGGITGE